MYEMYVNLRASPVRERWKSDQDRCRSKSLLDIIRLGLPHPRSCGFHTSQVPDTESNHCEDPKGLGSRKWRVRSISVGKRFAHPEILSVFSEFAFLSHKNDGFSILLIQMVPVK